MQALPAREGHLVGGLLGFALGGFGGLFGCCLGVGGGVVGEGAGFVGGCGVVPAGDVLGDAGVRVLGAEERRRCCWSREMEAAVLE